MKGGYESMDFTERVFSKDLEKISKLNQELDEVSTTLDQLPESYTSAIEIHLKEIDRLQNLIAMVEREIENKFKKYFEKGFQISGYEVAKMLDVTESYLFLKLKDKINYIKPPRVAFEYFKRKIAKREAEIDVTKMHTEKENRPLTDEELERIAELKKEVEYFEGLYLKKVFIEEDSLRKFLKEYAVVEVQRAQIVINQSELEHEINSRISNRIVKEVVKLYHDRAAERKKDDDAVRVLHSNLTDEVIEDLLSRKITFYSPKSIKSLIEKNNINELNSTVHDTQLYRFLDKKCEYTKVNITSTIKASKSKQKQSAIRYLLDIEIQAEMFVKAQDENYIIFSIPVSEYNEDIKQEVIDLINEAMEKYHQRKEKDNKRKQG